MGAIPSSTLPGHRKLHERTIVALGMCEESQSIDFKASAPWVALRLTITKTAMAMANLRDGGLIIVGVSEANGTWELQGITEVDLATYDPDVILDQVNTFASPPVALTFATVEHDGKLFLAIQVYEFSDLPVICKKNGHEVLKEGAIYVRPLGMPKSSTPRDASEIRELLDLAAEKLARRFAETAHRVGFHPTTSSPGGFDKELGGL